MCISLVFRDKGNKVNVKRGLVSSQTKSEEIVCLFYTRYFWSISVFCLGTTKTPNSPLELLIFIKISGVVSVIANAKYGKLLRFLPILAKEVYFSPNGYESVFTRN